MHSLPGMCQEMSERSIEAVISEEECPEYEYKLKNK